MSRPYGPVTQPYSSLSRPYGPMTQPYGLMRRSPGSGRRAGPPVGAGSQGPGRPTDHAADLLFSESRTWAVNFFAVAAPSSLPAVDSTVTTV